MYDPKSPKAEEFIDDDEIQATIRFARENRGNRELIEAVLEKAKECKGLNHRDALLLLECDQPDLNEKIFALAREIKQKFYGNRIVMFAPLYLSNYRVNGCTYCPYHHQNKHIRRKKLTQDEIRAEVIALQDMGHKRLALETGEDPVNNPIEYVLESIRTIYSIRHKNGAIRRVNVNIAATTVEELPQTQGRRDRHVYPVSGDLQQKGVRGTGTRPGRSTTTPTIPRRWTARWRAASTMSAAACFSG